MNAFYVVLTILIILAYFIIIINLTKTNKKIQDAKAKDKSLTKNVYFKLYTSQMGNGDNVSDETIKHFICVNEANGRVYLSLNESSAGIFKIVDTNKKNYFAIKEKNSPCYIHYSYPSVYQQKYEIYANNKDIDISTYLKFVFSKKHNGFHIKLSNGHTVVYNEADLMLYSTSNKLLDTKLVINIQEEI